ncbi:heterokaryon incompatibility protein-domain-containing protein, partial [Pestalotiopsis sp. NC0098]
MRLLNVNTLKLEEHFQQTPYAILSHRWRDGEEILYQDIADSGLVEALRKAKKSGYDKIIATCHQAKLAGITYIWVDTCCIDKSNSAELSEEINSMYRYYQDAHVCYAFLNGLFLDADISSDDKFAGHAWFERGWTLQELIAPREVIFFTDQAQGENPWACLGQRSGMCEKLSDITGIDADVLTGDTQPRLISVAKRMSWAARRMTTRIEDTAYCLMGLFGVNMPMLYGEGENAFVRLQEEIMKDSSDETLFAWRLEDVTASRRHGLLAPSPAAFKNSGGFPEYIDWEPRDPFFKTNRGLRITLPL